MFLLSNVGDENKQTVTLKNIDDFESHRHKWVIFSQLQWNKRWKLEKSEGPGAKLSFGEQCLKTLDSCNKVNKIPNEPICSETKLEPGGNWVELKEGQANCIRRKLKET